MTPPNAQVALYISFPRSERFNLAYYMYTHIPLCKREWKSKGLVGFTVATFEEGDIAVMTTLLWKTREMLDGVLARDGTSKVMADIATFSPEQPTMSVGHLVVTG